MTPIPIEDPTDERLAPYAGLKDAALRRAIERGEPGQGPGTFIAEGSLVLARLLASAY